jgi:hypothetical protein
VKTTLVDPLEIEVQRWFIESFIADGFAARRPPIKARRLLGIRYGWMVLYRPLLSADEFTKFVVLMKDLAPYLLLIIDPMNRSHRRDRSPTIGRTNLLWAINGHPSAQKLFE